MDSREQGPVEPPTSLGDKFGNLDSKAVSHNARGNRDRAALTLVGTSVAALALFTYFNLAGCVSARGPTAGGRVTGHLHPAFVLLRYNFEAEDTVLREIHVPLCRGVRYE